MNIAQNDAIIDFSSAHYKVDYGSWSIDWLSNYIEKRQEKTVVEFSNKIFHRTNQKNSLCHSKSLGLQTINFLCAKLLQELLDHKKKEEADLFPFIRELAHAIECKCILKQSAFHKIECTIAALNADHDIHRQICKANTQLANNYNNSIKGKPYFGFFSALLEFQQEHELHIFLQNRFLFPKIIALKYATV